MGVYIRIYTFTRNTLKAKGSITSKADQAHIAPLISLLSETPHTTTVNTDYAGIPQKQRKSVKQSCEMQMTLNVL